MTEILDSVTESTVFLSSLSSRIESLATVAPSWTTGRKRSSSSLVDRKSAACGVEYANFYPVADQLKTVAILIRWTAASSWPGSASVRRSDGGVSRQSL